VSCYPQDKAIATAFGVYLKYYTIPAPCIFEKIRKWVDENPPPFVGFQEVKFGGSDGERMRVLFWAMHMSQCPLLHGVEPEMILEIAAYVNKDRK